MTEASSEHSLMDWMELPSGDVELFGCEEGWTSCNDFVAASKVLAQQLKDAGVTAQQPVPILQTNCHRFALSLVALWRLNAVAVPLHLTTSQGEMESIWQELKPSTVLADSDTVHLPVVTGLPKGAEILVVDELLTHKKKLSGNHSAAPDDRAAIIYTSGSSGRPKGVIHTRSSLYHAVDNYIHELEEEAYFDRPLKDLTYLNLFPMATHVGVTNTLFTMAVGHRTYIPRQLELAKIVDVIAETKAEAVQLSPLVLREIAIEGEGIDANKLSSVQGWLTGGAAFTPEEVEQFESKFPGKIYVRFGLTEAAGGLLIQKPGGPRLGIGKPMYGTEAELVPFPGAKPGTGELRVRSKALAMGYLGREEEWAKVYRDGWFYTADLVRYDDLGNLHILSRIKNVIMSGVFQVWPAEVEATIRRIPDVKDCVAFGLSDDILGEVVGVAVVGNPNSQLQWQEVREFCSQNLFPQKLPRMIWITDRLAAPRVKVNIAGIKQQIDDITLGDLDTHRDVRRQECNEILSYYFGDDPEVFEKSFIDFKDDLFLAAEICWRLSLAQGKKISTGELYSNRPMHMFIEKHVSPVKVGV